MHVVFDSRSQAPGLGVSSHVLHVWQLHVFFYIVAGEHTLFHTPIIIQQWARLYVVVLLLV